MFNPKTERIKKLAELFPARVLELEEMFGSSANIYIDYANVRPWANKLRNFICWKKEIDENIIL